MVEFIKTLLIACIPSVVAGIGTYLVAKKNASSQIKIVKEQNKHDLDKLMEQHKVDIDSLKEKYRLEAEEKDREHARKLEIMEKEYEYKLKQQESEAENTAKYGAMKDVFGSVMGGMVTSAISSPEVQKRMTDAFADAFKKKDGDKQV